MLIISHYTIYNSQYNTAKSNYKKKKTLKTLF